MLCTEDKAGVCHTHLWCTTNIGSVQQHSALTFILGIFPNQEPETGSGNSKKDTTKETLYSQMARQITGALPFLTIKEDREQRQKTVMFGESNVMGAKTNMHTSMRGKLSTENRQSKPFKPRVYQGRG